jgi:hypothetical protein
MKFFKIFLLVLAIVLSSLRPRSYETSGTGMISGRQITLSYRGSVTSSEGTRLIGVVVYIDTTIGVRYDVVYIDTTNMTNAISNTNYRIYYKFSNPDQTVFYNLNTHKSEVIKAKGSTDPGQEVDVVGTENVSSYSCTHLQHRWGSHEVSDYWMSPNIPGFSKLVNALKKINPGMPALAFNVFNWGGLVKWTVYYVNRSRTLNLELHLSNANTKANLPATTWDVPTK